VALAERNVVVTTPIASPFARLALESAWRAVLPHGIIVVGGEAMKLAAAAVVVAAALVLPAAQAAERKTVMPPVLGFDQTKLLRQRHWTSVYRLAWFDPTTLATLRGRKARLGRYVSSWSFSPDRSVLAVAGRNTYQGQVQYKLRFVNARSMRVVGQLALPATWFINWVTWLGPDRLLAIVYDSGNRSLVVVDPSTRRLIRSVPLVRPPENVVRLPNGLALLLGSQDSIAPAVLAVVDHDGALRTVTLDRISIGTAFDGDVESHAGLTVDEAGDRAFVVDADFTVAEVDLKTLRVAYHGGSARSLAKAAYGPARSAAWLGSGIVAAWLGNGLLATAGVNYSGDETQGEPVGLRLIDTRSWSTRFVDPNVRGVWRVPGSPIFVATSGPLSSIHYDVYNVDGTLRYQFGLADSEWLRLEGPFGYVCGGTNKSRVLRMLSVADGLQERFAGKPPACPNLLYANDG